LVFPDGRTIRDSSSIAVIYGFNKKRDLNTTVKALPSREKNAENAISFLEIVLVGILMYFKMYLELSRLEDWKIRLEFRETDLRVIRLTIFWKLPSIA
jgi:hypothetical protein